MKATYIVNTGHYTSIHIEVDGKSPEEIMKLASEFLLAHCKNCSEKRMHILTYINEVFGAEYLPHEVRGNLNESVSSEEDKEKSDSDESLTENINKKYDGKVIIQTGNEIKNAQKPLGNYSCESCGAAITEKQHKISQMFTDKDLCEKCLQNNDILKSNKNQPPN